MTVEQMQAEFTQLTGLAAPSDSIHYMRKKLMEARRGRRDFKTKTPKTPTVTLTVDQVKALTDVLGKAKGDDAKQVAQLLNDFTAKHAK
jgi:GGDEF domain-containing protein